MTNRTASSPALADTGAQMCVAGLSPLHTLGATKTELIKLQNGVSTGWTPGGDTIATQQLVYISEGINTLFLSKTACRNLRIINADFPTVGHYRGSLNNLKEAEQLQNTGEKSVPVKQCKSYGPNDSLCDCKRRTLTPDPPTLPFKPTEENMPKLKQFIIDYYQSSAFNQCETQPLSLLQDSPPLHLFIDPDAKPSACHKPRPVPLHWQDEIKEGLDRLCRIRVM